MYFSGLSEALIYGSERYIIPEDGFYMVCYRIVTTSSFPAVAYASLLNGGNNPLMYFTITNTIGQIGGYVRSTPVSLLLKKGHIIYANYIPYGGQIVISKLS